MKRMIITDENRKKIIKLAHQYNAKVRFVDYLSYSGNCDMYTSVITMSIFETNLSKLYSTVLHEVGHIVAYKNQKYSAYHHRKSIDRLTIKEKRAAARTAIRAEIYVDKWAEKEFYKLFPNRKFHTAYRTEKDRNWLRKTFIIPTYL